MRNWKTIATVIVMIAASALIGGVVAGSPSQGEPVEGIAPGPQEAPDFALTEEEKATAMRIIESDAHIGEILQGADWHVQLIGPITEGLQKIGVSVFIKFDEAVWMEDTFYNFDYSYVAKLWVGALHISVDLGDGRIVGLTPGMGRAPITSPIKSPITSGEHAGAVEISLSHPVAKALGENVEAYLTAVYYIDEYPGGVAFFSMRSDQGEAMVAIDLDKMVVAEQYTGEIVSLER